MTTNDESLKIIRKKWDEKIDTIFQAVDMCCISLSEWEEEFLDSIQIRRSKGYDLTWNQSKCLNKIFDKVG